MIDPYCCLYWYWMTNSAGTNAPPPVPSLSEMLVVLLFPLLLLAACFGAALWETSDERQDSKLSRPERRALAAMETALSVSDPELARRLAEFTARTPAGPATGESTPRTS